MLGMPLGIRGLGFNHFFHKCYYNPLQELNAQFEGSLKKLLCRKLRPHVDEAILISIDKLGADVRVRVGSDYSVERIGWQKVHLPCQ